MTVPDKHYLLSKSWNKGCGLPLIKNYDKLAATVAMVAEFFIKMVAAACSNVVVFLTPFNVGNPNIYAGILALNITSCICAAIISVIESQFSTPLASQNAETKIILTTTQVPNVQPAASSSLIYLAIKAISMVTSFIASAINAAIFSDPSLPNATTLVYVAYVLSIITMAANNFITLGSSSAGNIYLTLRERIRQINENKQV